MNNTLLKVVPAVALSGLMLASASWAMGPGRGMDPERMVEHLSERLELTEEQRSQVDSIMAEGREQQQADHERMKEIRDALDEQAADFDAGETQALADELGTITTRMTYQMTSNHAAIYKLLTDEQREEMAEMRERHGDRKHRRPHEERD